MCTRKTVVPLGLLLSPLFAQGFAEVLRGDAEGPDHFAAHLGADLAAGEAGEDHGERVADGFGAAQRVEDVGAEARAGGEGARAGAAKLLMVVAEGAGAERRRLAEASVGFGVAAEWDIGPVEAHGCTPFGVRKSTDHEQATAKAKYGDSSLRSE
jgi:hypothetical protein